MNDEFQKDDELEVGGFGVGDDDTEEVDDDDLEADEELEVAGDFE